MKKLILVIGLAVGFVLGSRMGRGPYNKLEQTARQFADDPRVQEKVEQARDTAATTAREVASTVKEKAPEVAETAKKKAGDAADAAKDKAGQAAGTAKKAASSHGDASTAPAADTEGREAASSGGDAQVGEGKLES